METPEYQPDRSQLPLLIKLKENKAQVLQGIKSIKFTAELLENTLEIITAIDFTTLNAEIQFMREYALGQTDRIIALEKVIAEMQRCTKLDKEDETE